VHPSVVGSPRSLSTVHLIDHHRVGVMSCAAGDVTMPRWRPQRTTHVVLQRLRLAGAHKYGDAPPMPRQGTRAQRLSALVHQRPAA
jgi:hypothetical protein